MLLLKWSQLPLLKVIPCLIMTTSKLMSSVIIMGSEPTFSKSQHLLSALSEMMIIDVFWSHIPKKKSMMLVCNFKDSLSAGFMLSMKLTWLSLERRSRPCFSASSPTLPSPPSPISCTGAFAGSFLSSCKRCSLETARLLSIHWQEQQEEDAKRLQEKLGSFCSLDKLNLVD